MSYNTVAEIYEAIDEARARLLTSVEGLADGQETFRPAPERWSIAEIVEHLALVEGQIARVFRLMLSKAEAAGALREEADSATPFADPVTIEHLLEPLREKKLQAPDNARPGGTAALPDSLARLAESRAAIRELRPRLERVDGSALVFPHPAAGPINAYQWLLFIGSHEDRHRLQIEALKRTMNDE